jgi:hypothetical protein
VSAEVIGLDQSIAYAQHLAAEAGQHAPDGNERYLASLTGRKVTGECLASAEQMQAAFAAAAAAATAHAENLAQQKIVQEQYDVNPDAGDKDFQTGDTDGGQAEPPRPASAAEHDPAAGDGPAPAAAASPAEPAHTGRPLPEPPPATKRDGDVPVPPPAPADSSAPAGKPMVRVNYTVRDTATGNSLTVGCIDVDPALAYADDRTLTTSLTQELHRRGSLPSGSHVAVSPRSPGQPPMSWVRYAIKDGSRTVGEGSIQVNLSKAPAGGDAALAAAITSHLRSQGSIAHDWHVRVLGKVS